MTQKQKLHVKYNVGFKVETALEMYNLNELAKALGVDERTIRRWRQGEVAPSLYHYIELCALVDGDEGDNPSSPNLNEIFVSKKVA